MRKAIIVTYEQRAKSLREMFTTEIKAERRVMLVFMFFFPLAVLLLSCALVPMVNSPKFLCGVLVASTVAALAMIFRIYVNRVRQLYSLWEDGLVDLILEMNIELENEK